MLTNIRTSVCNLPKHYPSIAASKELNSRAVKLACIDGLRLDFKGVMTVRFVYITALEACKPNQETTKSTNI